MHLNNNKHDFQCSRRCYLEVNLETHLKYHGFTGTQCEELQTRTHQLHAIRQDLTEVECSEMVLKQMEGEGLSFASDEF